MRNVRCISSASRSLLKPFGLGKMVVCNEHKTRLEPKWFGENIQKMSFADLIRDAAGFIDIVKREYIRIKVFGF